MESIPRRMFVAALLLCAVPARADVGWRDAADYVTLFAPVNQRAAYTASVSSAMLESVLAGVNEDPAAVQAPGSWQPRIESATDAFGTAGLQNRWLLAQLYGSRGVSVARGSRMDRGRVIESWTLLSPYPSTDLRTLNAGTLRLVLKIAP